MRLPNADHARVPKRKLTAYLLDPEHGEGGPKAAYFISRGFRIGAWELFAERLREHAAAHPVTETAPGTNGTSYIVEGPLRTPGRSYTKLPVRVVWMIDTDADVPRLITAYPVSF